LDFEIPTVQPFMVLAAKRLQCTEPECRDVAAMVFDVMDDVGNGDAAFELAQLTQRVACEVVSPAASPTAGVVGSTAIVAALATAAKVELGAVGSAHGGMLARAPPWRKAN
jgi:hypothetical protein